MATIHYSIQASGRRECVTYALIAGEINGAEAGVSGVVVACDAGNFQTRWVGRSRFCCNIREVGMTSAGVAGFWGLSFGSAVR